jgi:ketosteroid isomerase-like protein
MKGVPIAVVLMVSLPYLAAGQSAIVNCDANANARSLCNTEMALAEALRRNDANGLSQIYDDQFRLINFRGRRIDGAAVLAAITSGALRFESLTTSQLELSLYENTGIVTGVQDQVAREPGGDAAHPQQVRFTHVYVLRGGRWRLVSSQITPMLR